METAATPVWGMAVSPDGRWMAVSGRNHLTPVVELIDLETKEVRWSAEWSATGYRIAWTPDSERFLVGTQLGTPKLYGVEEAVPVKEWPGRDEVVQSAAVTDDGGLLVWGSYDGSVTVVARISTSATRAWRDF